ncbi:MAG: carbohydrate-binding domain-containing protein [Pseudomonadota bacterium]
MFLIPPGIASTPTCLYAASDTDGDGWGWENDQSCIVAFAPNSAGWPSCSTATSDPDGDGYGWENSQTCVVTVLTPDPPGTQHPVCQSAASDPDGDGWGWENLRSCIVQTTTAPSGHPYCTQQGSDPDNDGWGWENDQSCVVANNADNNDQNTNGNHPVCQSATSDPDNDGWGWEDDQSCVVTASTNNDSTPPDNDNPTTPDSNHPACQFSNSDPDNDGWGWENDQSCIVTAATGSDNSNGDTDNSTPDPKTTPVTDSGHPICLTTASDSNGTGYGYEFNRSCQVVEGISKTAEDPLFYTEMCDSWAEIPYGNYRIQNNTWNNSAVYSDRWSQCIELQQNSSGEPVAVWRFDWLARDEGNLDQVKSYPQVYYGRKNERNLTGTPEQTGLPRPIDDLDRYQIDYAFSTVGDAEYNVALESFFHSSCEAGDDNKQFEMMVWVGVPGEKTPGTQITTASIDGTTWKVYANPVLSWGYVAFVAEQTTPTGVLDWNAFIDWSRENSASLGLGDMENTCMGAIEMGTETFWGELEFRLDRFDVIRY